MQNRIHLAVAAAIIGLAARVQAGFFDGSTDFEGANPLSDACWGNVGEAAVVVDASVASAPRAAALPPSFDATSRTNVLCVDDTDPIVRYLQTDQAAPSASTIYADVLVKGSPLPAGAAMPEAGADDKILVYTRVSQSGDATNLCVYAKDAANGTAQEFVLTTTIGDDEWHRLVIKATAEGYQVYCDGTDAANLCKTAGDIDTFYALNAGDPMTSLAFAGDGYVDDIILSDFDPSKSILAWGAGFQSVSYTVNGQPGDPLTVADGEALIEAAVGDTIVLSGFTGYRTVSNVCTVASLPVTLELSGLTGIARYFPQSATAGQDGTAGHPYEIPDLAALKVLQAAVAGTTNCAGICFLQTADIALDAAWPGIGIQNGKDLVTSKTAADVETFNAEAFRGTYDGGNFTVSNFQMVGVAGNPANNGEGLDYCGFFNSTYGATICNLKIQYAGSLFAADTTASTKESGATFVGVAKNSTLRNLTTVAGTVSCSKGFGGIVGYLFGTTVDSCTNNLNMTSLANNKCGGIAMICQQSDCSILNCQNNGTATTSSGEHGGIVGYTDTITISNCENTAACKMFYHHGGTVTLSGTNKGNSTVQSYTGNATPGLNFATVEGDVATFVADDALASGGTYKVMASGVTATYAFSAPGTISFDEALFAPTYAVTAPDLALTDATEGTVRTYTAAAITAATWIGGAQGDWETNTNWSVGYVPTKDTVVTFTNDAQVAILSSTDRCKELVLDNANVTLVRDANATKPVLHFSGNEGRAVSVASGATGSLGVNGIALFTDSTDRNNNLTIGCALAVLSDVTFRGINIIPNQLAASFTITGKTTISADATVKTIDWGNTIFLGGIEVAKGVTAKIQTDPNGYAQIGAAVTLVANDGEGDSTTIWLMRSSNRSGKVSLVLGASVSVDADHAATHFIKTSSDEVTDEHGLNPITCDVYTATRNPTVFVTANGVTVTGVENGQRVVPGTNLVISVSGLAEGYTPSVTVMKHEDYSELLTTNAVSFTYTMPDFDIDVVADATAPSYKDPEDREIGDLGLIKWLSDNDFSQDDINALGDDAEATDKLYECWLLNCSITAQNPGGTIHTTGIAVTNGVVSITVQLVRQSPLGFISGVLHIYGTDDLADDFSLISEEIVGISEGDSTFATAETDGAVTQSVTATFSPTDVTATFFKSKIEFQNAGDPDEPEEPDDPDDPEGSEE